MRKQVRQTVLCLVAAVIGAGFATGREIAVSFARFGSAAALAVAGAVLTLAAVSWALLCRSRNLGCACVEQLCRGRLRSAVRICFLVLMAVTGGAMLAGGANVAALLLPVRGAWWIGWGALLLAGGALCRRSLRLLTWLGGALTACLLAVMLLGLALPSYESVQVADTRCALVALDGLAHGCCWAGFNLAFASPLLCEAAGGLAARQRCKAALGFAGVLGALLGLGVALLQKHALLLAEEMPLIRLLSAFGQGGYVLGAAGLLLAIFTTLLSALRALAGLTGQKGARGTILACGASALVSAAGFDGLVRVAYPVVGGACLVLLAAALCQGKTDRTAKMTLENTGEI